MAVVVLEWWAALGAALVPLLQAIQSTAAAGPLLWMGDSWRYLGAASGEELACPANPPYLLRLPGSLWHCR